MSRSEYNSTFTNLEIMNEFEFPFKEGKIVVVIDDREAKSGASRKLFELGVVLEFKRLEVADFLCSSRIAIERKTAADFEDSLMDGRLFEQLKAHTDNFDSPLLCIVGKEFTRLNPKAIKGAFISIATNFRVPIFFFKNEEELAEFIFHCAQREQEKKDCNNKLRFGKKGVGPTQAKRLLKHFKTPELVFEADEEDLAQVQGIGEEKAKEIRKILSQKQE